MGWGTVIVPFGGPLPCLVMRTYQTSHAEWIGVPITIDYYKIYRCIAGDGSDADSIDTGPTNSYTDV